MDDIWLTVPSEDDAFALLEICCMAGLAAACRVDLRRLAFGAVLAVKDADWFTGLDGDAGSLIAIYARRLETVRQYFSERPHSRARFVTIGVRRCVDNARWQE
jgi:hypothetical protein